jgi:serine phosphatase RsbU (regulator of sigma subunit)
VVFYTDGVTEAINNLGQTMGLERLFDAIQQNAEKSTAEEIIAGLEKAVNQFCGEVPKADDIALVTMKVS